MTGRLRSRDVFPTDAPIAGDDLIGRAVEVGSVREDLAAGVHQVLLGPRRRQYLRRKLQTLKRQINSRVWRMNLNDPDHGALGVTGNDKRHALFLLVRRTSEALGRGVNLWFPGLAADGDYRVVPVPPISPSAEQCLSPTLRSGPRLRHGTTGSKPAPPGRKSRRYTRGPT